ncbi:MAG: SH3 domain-containing protein [Treponema sp.]|jgi:hypothetical protein|nr:SH3 domain-containing protein [Treponema sp.]
MKSATKLRLRVAIVLSILIGALCTLGACQRTLGWGLLLWAVDDPPIPSGTVLPVYVQSHLNKTWIVGVPKEYRRESQVMDKIEIPLYKLELVGGRGRARARAAAFETYAGVYAETLRDGLVIRVSPENNARQVYRLRENEIIKVLDIAKGVAPVGTSGEALSGDWYYVLTSEGTMGYCFSNRLRLFNYMEDEKASAETAAQGGKDDPELERILNRKWYPERWGTMVENERLNLDELRKRYYFDPGTTTAGGGGTARIYAEDAEKKTVDRSFRYESIKAEGSRRWRFGDTSLLMILRNESLLAVQYNDSTGQMKTLLFVTLPKNRSTNDLIAQESNRQAVLMRRIVAQGPVFSSRNYGSLRFSADGRFTWTGSAALVPRIIPGSALEKGMARANLFLDPPLAGRYNGGLTFRFDGAGGESRDVRFIYNLENDGLRLEYVPPGNINIDDGVTVLRRAPSPTVLYFYKGD